MSQDDRSEEADLRETTLRNVKSIVLARERAERELLETKEALERRNDELARSLALMQATLESSTDAMLATDAQGRVTAFNASCLEMWALGDEVIASGEHGRYLETMSAFFADPDAFLARMDEIATSAHSETSDLLELKDARAIELHSRTQYLGDADIGRVWSFRDVTGRRRAEAAIWQQREWFEITLASIGDAVITTDVEQTVTFMNRVAERMTGWSLEQAQNRPLAEVCRIVKERDRRADAELLAATEFPVEDLGSHSVLIARDGRETAIEDTAAPIRDAAGNVLGAVMVFHDVTIRRQTERALREETHALEVLNRTGATIAARLDQQSVLQAVTDAATELSGAKFGSFFYTAEDENGEALILYTLSGAPREAFERLGRPRATDLFGPTFRGEPPIRCDDVTTDSRYGRWEPHHGMPKGHLPVRSYLAVPVVSGSGEVMGGLFFGHPEPGVFTERAERVVTGIAAHAAIAIDNARLYEAAQQEIANRQRAEEALREADRRKDEFLATLAHELRNPLAPILQAATLMRTDSATDAQLRWSHDVIDRQVRHMSLLLDDLLDVSRITRGQLSLRKQWIVLGDVIDAALETVGPVLEARNQEFLVDLADDPIWMLADPLRLAQVLSNLVSNAAKYTPAGNKIRLVARLDAGEVLISIIDPGAGIAEEWLPVIFEMFSQARGVEQPEGGLGIGLALVRGLLELHGGSIEAKSDGPGCGSEFSIRLPQGAPPAAERTVDTTSGWNLAGVARRVLVADDNRDSADSLALLLQAHGHFVRVAYDGEHAIEEFVASRPDVVVLDIGMPKLDGYTTARRIRDLPNGRPVTLIAMTGWGQEADKRRARDAGFNHHLTKPVDPKKLVALL